MTQPNIQPLASRVLIRRTDAEAKTPGGIMWPDSAQEKPKRGKVLQVGVGRLMDDGGFGHMLTKPGDDVIFGSYAGTEIEVDGKTFLVMEESDILAVVG